LSATKLPRLKWHKGEIVRDERTIPLSSSDWAAAFSTQVPMQFQLGWINSLTGQRAFLNEGGGTDFYFSWKYTTPDMAPLLSSLKMLSF
jgi:hypothetical protein